MNFVVQFLIGLAGLGLATDYSPLISTRWREKTQHASSEDAVIAAI